MQKSTTSLYDTSCDNHMLLWYIVAWCWHVHWEVCKW